MRLFQRESIQKNFVESFGFSLEGTIGFEYWRVGLGRTFQREGTAWTKAECAKCQGGQQCRECESSGESRELRKDGGVICTLDKELWSCPVDDSILCQLRLCELSKVIRLAIGSKVDYSPHPTSQSSEFCDLLSPFWLQGVSNLAVFLVIYDRYLTESILGG